MSASPLGASGGRRLSMSVPLMCQPSFARIRRSCLREHSMSIPLSWFRLHLVLEQSSVSVVTRQARATDNTKGNDRLQLLRSVRGGRARHQTACANQIGRCPGGIALIASPIVRLGCVASWDGHLGRVPRPCFSMTRRPRELCAAHGRAASATCVGTSQGGPPRCRTRSSKNLPDLTVLNRLIPGSPRSTGARHS